MDAGDGNNNIICTAEIRCLHNLLGADEIIMTDRLTYQMHHKGASCNPTTTYLRTYTRSQTHDRPKHFKALHVLAVDLMQHLKKNKIHER